MKPHLQTTVWTLPDAGACQREIQRVTGIDRKTMCGEQKPLATAAASNSRGVAIGSLGIDAGSAQQLPPSWPPASGLAPPLTAVSVSVSACERHRALVEAPLRLRRNSMEIYHHPVDYHGFAGACNSGKRFALKLRHREPEQFDRLAVLPGEEMRVDDGEGALTRVPGAERPSPYLYAMSMASTLNVRCWTKRSSRSLALTISGQSYREVRTSRTDLQREEPADAGGRLSAQRSKAATRLSGQRILSVSNAGES